MTAPLRLRVARDGIADVYRTEDDDTTLIAALTPDAADELLHLLVQNLGACMVCSQPLWLETAGWCAGRQLPYGDCCGHRECRSQECAVAI